MSDEDLQDIGDQLRGLIAQLRDVPRTGKAQEMAICNALRETCRDPRIRGAEPVGPFADEAAFSQGLRFPDDAARRGHEIFFTHADLNPRNILVDRVAWPDGSGSGGSAAAAAAAVAGWAVTGIVDWETAGYYPEYWEYAKARFEGFRWPRRYNDLVHGVFRQFGDYSAEFDVEKRSWESGDAV